MRKLASIQEIKEIRAIENADKLEVVNILGWKVVVKKNEFKIGDKCIYCEIDSVLPEREEFEFLKDKKYRIKTVKLRGQVSQGICFPLTILSEGSYNIGDDVTEVLGVIKYEMPIPESLSGEVRGDFPSYIPKTDETRIQAVPDLLEEMSGLECYITIKLDGSSMTVCNLNNDVQVCSRNLSLKKTDKSAQWNVVEKYDLENKIKECGNIGIQGEIVGVGIQKNRLELKDKDFFVFNVYDIDNARYFSYNEMCEICNRLELKRVPLLEKIKMDNSYNINKFLEMAKGKYEGTNNHREGIVIRPIEERYSKVLSGRMSFKVINNDYLLHGGE